MPDPRPGDQDICAGRHKGAETSTEAFQSTPDSKRQRQRISVLNHIHDQGGSGATCEETSISLGIPYTACSARVSELLRDGAIHFTKARRKTTHGKPARVLYSGGAPPDLQNHVQASLL